MAISTWWLTRNTETSISVSARCDSNDQVTLSINGGAYLGTPNTAVDDGVVVIEATGLIQNTEYQFSLEQGGQIENGIAKTMPANGNFRFGWGSCISYNNDVSHLSVLRENPDFFIHQGDQVYSDINNGTLFGVTFEPTYKTNTLANYYAHQLVSRMHPGISRLLKSVPQYYQLDDHEIFNNWDWSYGYCNQFYDDIGNFPDAILLASTSQDIQDVYDRGMTSYKAYSKGNPVNTDSGIDAGAVYTRWRLGSMAEFFILDQLSYRDLSKKKGAYAADDPVKTANDPTKVMLGVNQKAWLKARLLQAQTDGVKYKFISSKKTFVNVEDNDDTWSEYQAERDEIISYIQTNNITGVVWLSGDTHDCSVYYNETTGHINVCACPMGASNQSYGQGVGYNANVVYKAFGHSGDVRENQKYYAFGIVDVNDEYCEIRIKRSRDRRTLWKGRIYAGSNELVYPDTNISL